MENKLNQVIAIVGLGYVGLPLALEFSKKFEVIGFDINADRLNELRSSLDYENSKNQNPDEKNLNLNIKFTNNVEELMKANIFIIAVPTPVDLNNIPDLTQLKKACESISTLIQFEDIVIFESTVFPGATEEICIPILEGGSGLTVNQDFYVGYSPERINPGDKSHELKNIVKIISGSTSETTKHISQIYEQIIEAGLFIAPNIKVAEAAKIIENIQRDVNIALVNEFAIIFDKMNIDIYEVLKAASTKWNFHTYKPGLVGGHCIGVDPYYLTYKAAQLGYDSKMVLAGREMNNSMPKFVAQKLHHRLKLKYPNKEAINGLIIGYTFKENVSDVRNSGVERFVYEMEQFNVRVNIFDPVADIKSIPVLVRDKFIGDIKNLKFDFALLAVDHDIFSSYLEDIDLSVPDGQFYSIKEIDKYRTTIKIKSIF